MFMSVIQSIKLFSYIVDDAGFVRYQMKIKTRHHLFPLQISLYNSGERLS